MKNATVAVVGGVNVDIGGRPRAKLLEADSNPGRVWLSVGGVGRNIAHNLSLLDVPVMLFTAYGEDAHGKLVEESCASAGIDLTRALKIKGGATPTYLFITDETGEMRLAVADMEACESISPEYAERNKALLNEAAAVVFDTNIPERTVEWLAENCTAPLFADPVSTAKAGKLKNVLGRLYCVKPNRVEAERLSGVHIENERDMFTAADKLLETGLKELFISDGANGVYAFAGGERIHIPSLLAQVKNTTGAGDAFMAGLIRGYLEGGTLYERGLTAAMAACISVESGSTVNPALSMEAIEKKKNELSGGKMT